MRFGLTPEQIGFTETLNRALRRVCPLDRVRAFAEGDAGVEDEVWRTLSEMGAAGLLIPETAGGLGLGLLDAALAAEAVGRGAAPAPFIATAGLAPLALRADGGTLALERLEAIAGGRLRIAAGIGHLASGVRDGAGLRVSNGRLSGHVQFVFDAPAPGLMLVADDEGALYLVDPSDRGAALAPMRTIDRTRRFAEARLQAVAAERLDTPPGTAERLIDAAFVLLAADCLGAASTLLETAVAYAGAREQFGRPIAAFQAVKHLCAEMAAALEPARALVWYAAYAFDAGLEDAPVAAAHAKAHLSDVGRFVARTATEVHGGAGFTDRQGVHFHFKRIEVDRQLFGGPERVRRRAAGEMGLLTPTTTASA